MCTHVMEYLDTLLEGSRWHEVLTNPTTCTAGIFVLKPLVFELDEAE